MAVGFGPAGATSPLSIKGARGRWGSGFRWCLLGHRLSLAQSGATRAWGSMTHAIGRRFLLEHAATDGRRGQLKLSPVRYRGAPHPAQLLHAAFVPGIPRCGGFGLGVGAKGMSKHSSWDHSSTVRSGNREGVLSILCTV